MKTLRKHSQREAWRGFEEAPDGPSTEHSLGLLRPHVSGQSRGEGRRLPSPPPPGSSVHSSGLCGSISGLASPRSRWLPWPLPLSDPTACGVWAVMPISEMRKQSPRRAESEREGRRALWETRFSVPSIAGCRSLRFRCGPVCGRPVPRGGLTAVSHRPACSVGPRGAGVRAASRAGARSQQSGCPHPPTQPAERSGPTSTWHLDPSSVVVGQCSPELECGTLLWLQREDRGRPEELDITCFTARSIRRGHLRSPSVPPTRGRLFSPPRPLLEQRGRRPSTASVQPNQNQQGKHNPSSFVTQETCSHGTSRWAQTGI